MIEVDGKKLYAKPLTGGPSNYSNAVKQLDEHGNIIDVRTSGAPLDTRYVKTPQEAATPTRSGDYYINADHTLSVVPNSPTDIFNKWKITDDSSLYSKPTRDYDLGLTFAQTVSGAVGGGLGAAAGKAVFGTSLAGSVPGLMIGVAAAGIGQVINTGVKEKAYQDALDKWQKSQENAKWSLAGDMTVDADGNTYFTPDPSKAISMNIAFSGSEVQKAFDTETKVSIDDNGLNVEVNPIFAATEEYKNMVEKIKNAYAGLTKDTENVDEHLDTIRTYINTANNQYMFREQSRFAYKLQLPDASEEKINDAYINELGAYMSEKEGEDYDVKVYRDGKIETKTAKDVLENVYNKDLGQRSDYMLDLFSKLDDPNIPDDDKVYILSEIRLLNAADSNEEKYDNGVKDDNGGAVKTTNKYFGMLDQESIVSWASNYSVFGGVTVLDIINALNNITPWNMYTSNQAGLQEDPAAASAAKVISSATSAMASYFAMQGIEYGVVRPVVGKAKEALGLLRGGEAAAEGAASVGEQVVNAANEAVAEGNSRIGAALHNLINGARTAAGPYMHALGYSASELLYNATSDLIFDALKQGTEALAGNNPTSEDFLNEFGTDLIMDLILQYGPAGAAQIRMEMDNYRVDQAFAPYKESINTARQTFDAAELEYSAVKQELSEMRKGSKKYAEKEAELKTKEKAYNKAKKAYDSLKVEAETAVKEAMPTASEELGAILAGKFASIEENSIVMWLRKKLTDEKAALSVAAEQAYNKTHDVYLYAAAVNKLQSIQAGIKEVSTKMISLDSYAKGTGESYVKFANASIAAAPGGKYSKSQIQYLVAKSEYDAWMKYAAKDKSLQARIEDKYLPYLNKVDSAEAERLDQVLETMKGFLKKVGESYVKSGAATKQQIKDIENAALGDGYIPLWGKKGKIGKFGTFETPLTLNVGRTFDPEKDLFDVEIVENPVKSALGYTHNVINNIARNEIAGMLKEIASIDGLDVEIVDPKTDIPKVEYQSAINKAINRVVAQRGQMIDVELSPEKYLEGLRKAVYTNGDDKISSDVDGLIKEQKKLRDLAKSRKTGDIYTNKEIKELESLNNAIKKAKNNAEIETISGKIKDIELKASTRNLQKINKLRTEIAAKRDALRSNIDDRIKAAGKYFNKQYKKYGITVDVDDYLSSEQYSEAIDSKLRSMSTNNLLALKEEVAKMVTKVAPYLSVKRVNSKNLSKEVDALKEEVRAKLDKDHPDYSYKKKYAIVGKAVEDFKAQLKGEYGAKMSDEINTPGTYKIPFRVDGKDASFYIRGKLAQEISAEMTTRNVSDRKMLSEFFKEAANIKRLLTTGIDPTRVLPNLVRDTIVNGIRSGGTDYWFFDNSPFGFQKMFTKMAKSIGATDEQINEAFETLRAVQDIGSGATYNEAFAGKRRNSIKRLSESSTAVGKRRGVRFIWDVLHNKKAALESPMNWAEGLTRDRAGASAFLRAYMRGGEGLSHETRLKNAYEAGVNAARENTTNFLRRGTFIKELSSYVPYLSQKFSNLESTKISFLKDPIGVSTRMMMFGAAYMMELSRVLSDEKTRKNYYNLSEFDRENNIIISLGDGSLATIPLDETLAAIIYPWRRGIETLNNVDPENFFMIMVNGLLDLSPFDLSGFTEGDSFNFGRGLEKLGAETLPTIVQWAYTQATGRNMYFGSNVAVTKESLAEYGNYNPSFGDYTTPGNNSFLLRHIADALGIEQWRLQQSIADLGGNVGQYVVNWLDKIANAPEDAQGGKDFMDATFKSFTGMDSNQVYYAFNDGIDKLTVEKEKVKQELVDMNEKISLASGTRLAELQAQYRKIKQDFAMKVGNFVDKYIGAYEIAGGLSKSQANKLWYLLNFSDDDSIAMGGSVESYYRNLAKKQANNEATKYSADILDKYLDQTKNIYRDSEGTWHYYSPYGEQAFFNTVQGRGMEYQVGLRNLIEGDLSNLSAERSAAYDAREAAYNAKNWDEYDKIGLRFDEKVLNTIAPYVNRYGAKNVLTNSSVLDYLEEWFFVPSSYMKSKYGKNVSLAHNASKQRAFVRPYIKDLFKVGSGYTENNYVSRPDRLVRGE